MKGPVQGHWCYAIERQQKVLRTKCKNKCKIETSIAEAYCAEEVSNFTTKYYAETLPNVHNPPPRYNAEKMKRTSASLEGNSEVQVVRLLRPCNMKSGGLS